MPAGDAGRKKSVSASAIGDVLPGAAAFLRAAAVVAIVIFVFLKWSFVSDWLSSISHFEGFGTKFDRAAANEILDKFKQASHDKQIPFDLSFAETALARAEAVAPALIGARVLWVDQNPKNNAFLVTLFQNIGIRVQLALNTEEGITFARMEEPSTEQIFDLVISNQIRDEKSQSPLQKCPAAYFAFPTHEVKKQWDPNDDDNDPNKYKLALSKFNKDVQDNPPAGFGLAEQFAQRFPNQFADTQKSRVILFAAKAGGISASACVRIVTNRYDVLLQSVIGALEELRGNLITRPSQPSPSPAQEAAALQGQADFIYQTQRLAVCQSDPKNCSGK